MIPIFSRNEQQIAEDILKQRAARMKGSYHVNQVDLAGNDFVIFRAETFEHACEQVILAKRARPNSIFYIINSEQADVDFDGLTDEERELLP